ncbi:MAG TPA: hypothetical protein VHM93_10840 [Candidatus Acidoferrum sp.]|nr:hypothetical protein [Candidatus Acidoferrum sp.]
MNNDFAPVTFRFGFIETPFSSPCDAFREWFRAVDAKHPNLRTEFTRITAPLATALLSLEPLTNPSDCYLLVETKSNWTAVFANGLRVNDVATPTGYLPTVLNCRGLEVGYTPDLSKSKRKDSIRMWANILFALYGPTKTDWLNRIRHLHASNDVDGWTFDEGGELQPFEEAEAYKKRRIQDRLTFEMLERYCKALGIELNQDDFYGSKSCSVRTTGQKQRGDLAMSIAEARSHLDL